MIGLACGNLKKDALRYSLSPLEGACLVKKNLLPKGLTVYFNHLFKNHITLCQAKNIDVLFSLP